MVDSALLQAELLGLFPQRTRTRPFDQNPFACLSNHPAVTTRHIAIGHVVDASAGLELGSGEAGEKAVEDVDKHDEDREN
jgi:hypothetical protein